MRSFAIGLLLLASIAAAPATRPASTRPTEPAKQRYTLMNGAVRYMIPVEFKETNRSEAGRDAQYQSADEKCVIVVGVVPQDLPFPQHNEALIEKMKTSVLNGMRKHFQEHGYEILYGPRSETDDRFLLRIHARYKHEGQTIDEVHTFRAAGLDLLTVLTQVKSGEAKEIKTWDEVGEDTCLSIVLGPADKKKPATAPRSSSK